MVARSFVFLIVLALIGATRSVSAADDARAALMRKYGDTSADVRVEEKSGRLSIEFCFDLCDYYEGRRVRSVGEMWDLVFLHQYYDGDDRLLAGFREATKPLADTTLQRYSALCKGPMSQALYLCEIKALAKRNHVRLGSVRYDEGSRCLSWLKWGSATYMSDSVCTDVKAP